MSLFKDAADETSVYKNRDALKERFIPDEIVGRDEEKREYVNALKPVLQGDSPDNVFLHGPTGVGKTALTRSVLNDLTNQPGLDDLTVKWVNCNSLDSTNGSGETTIMLEIANQFRSADEKFATTGYKKARARDLMFREINKERGTIMIVLDEVDAVDEHNTILYQLSRPHETGKVDPEVDIGIIGISNDPTFLDEIEADVKRSLSETELSFSEYDAKELRAVLAHRAALAFRSTKLENPGDHANSEIISDVLENGVVELAAAYASKTEGDARLGISLLRHAGDLARDSEGTRVNEEHVKEALRCHERDKMEMVVERMESTAKIILYALVTLTREKGKNAATGEESPGIRTSEITGRYQNLCDHAGMTCVSTRQVRKHLKRFQKMGLTEQLTQRGGPSGRYSVHQLTYDLEIVFSAISDYVVENVGVVKSVDDLADVETENPVGAD